MLDSQAAPNESTSVSLTRDSAGYQSIDNENENHSHSHSHSKDITKFQRVMLALDGVAHINEVTTPIMTGIQLVSNSNPVKIVGGLVALTMGGVSAYADVRTCKNSVKKDNCGHSHGLFSADRWTIANAAFSWAATVIGLTLDIGLFIENCKDKPETDKNIFGLLSTASLIMGLLVGASAATGATYCHFILNKNHEKEDNKDHDNGSINGTTPARP